MSASHLPEPSYYEVSLTHRQVVGALAILLACVFAAFLAGVWLGRASPVSQEASSPVPSNETAAVPLERLTFFEEPAGRQGTQEANRATEPRAVPAAETAQPASGSESAAGETTPGAAGHGTAAGEAEIATEAIPSDRATGGSPAGTTVAVMPEPDSSRDAPTAPFFVQVFSSNNEVRARELVARLRNAKFSVVLLEPREPGGNYRVRVGPYGSRERAEAAARRLQREHRLQTWITDQS